MDVLLIPQVQLRTRIAATLEQNQTAVSIGFDNLKTTTSTAWEIPTVVPLLGYVDVLLELLAASGSQLLGL
jgi:hypothetical protein